MEGPFSKESPEVLVFSAGVEESLIEACQLFLSSKQFVHQSFEATSRFISAEQKHQPHLIVVDLDRCGDEASRIFAYAQSISECRPVVIGLVSEESSQDLLGEYRSCLDDLLIKPVKSAQLEMALERGAQIHQLRNDNTRLRRMSDRLKMEVTQQLFCGGSERRQSRMRTNSSKKSTLDNIELSRKEKRWKRLLHKEKNLDRLLKDVIDLITTEWHVRQASVMLIDRSDGRLSIKKAVGLDPRIVENTRVPIGKGPSGYVAETQKPLLVQDTLDYLVSNWPRRYSHVSFASVPLVCAGELIGVLNVTGKTDGKILSEPELESLNAFASVAAEALDRLMIGEELRQGYLATIQALALAIERKDPYTNGHSNRVSRYSVALARKMGLEESEADRIESAAILHDIGKIAVPYDILHKPGPLNAQENLVLRKHPEYGSQLLSFLRNYDVERETVRHHHEWFDGRGYPDGLRGEQLTLCTRIVAVADVYDALTTFRSYRVPQDRHSAFLEIEACSGTQFDPDVVEAMRSLMREDVWPVLDGVEEEVASTF